MRHEPGDGDGPRGGRGVEPHRVALLVLAVLALLSRLVWSLALHPPGEAIFSDMDYYVARAERLVAHGAEAGRRELAWQAWGTHALLAGVMAVSGSLWKGAAAAVWALCSAATVVLGYLLACRLLRTQAAALVVGVVGLLWWPSISNAGYFLSEAPFAAALLAASLLTVGGLEARGDGTAPRTRCWVGAGLAWAAALALRPQAAASLALLGIAWVGLGGARPRLGGRELVALLLPVALVGGISVERFHRHTGRWGGVAEAAELNRTIGRCHQLITLAHPTPQMIARADGEGRPPRTRRVVAPAIRALHRLPESHPLHERGALGPRIEFEGYIGEPRIHRRLRASCREKTGLSGQLRMAVAHTLTAWLWSPQWPEKSEAERPALRRASEAFRWLSWPIGLLGLGGLGLALARARERPALLVPASHLLAFLAVSAVFFASVRTRLPYDPYWLLCAALCVESLALSRRGRGA